MTIWADGDSLQAGIRNLVCRRANHEAADAAALGKRGRFHAVFVAARMPPLEPGPFPLDSWNAKTPGPDPV